MAFFTHIRSKSTASPHAESTIPTTAFSSGSSLSCHLFFLLTLSLDVPFSWHLFLLASLLFSTLLFSALDPSVFLCISLYFFNLCSAEISLSLLWQWRNWTNTQRSCGKGEYRASKAWPHAPTSSITSLHLVGPMAGIHHRSHRWWRCVNSSLLFTFRVWWCSCHESRIGPLYFIYFPICQVSGNFACLTQLSALMCWWLEAEISAQ